MQGGKVARLKVSDSNACYSFSVTTELQPLQPVFMYGKKEGWKMHYSCFGSLNHKECYKWTSNTNVEYCPFNFDMALSII